MNKREAVQLFAQRDFNNIPLSLVEKAYEDELCDFIILPTQPQEDDYETVEEYELALGEWDDISSTYPMWGTLFECNDRWLGETILEHRNEVIDMGFIILDGFEELNVCLGVGGCGYDFYDAHWTPLYDLLGLKWHNEN